MKKIVSKTLLVLCTVNIISCIICALTMGNGYVLCVYITSVILIFGSGLYLFVYDCWFDKKKVNQDLCYHQYKCLGYPTDLMKCKKCSKLRRTYY